MSTENIENTQPSPSMSDERRQTNADLSAERKKTDELLERLQKAVQEVDEAVKANIKKAAKIRRQQRRLDTSISISDEVDQRDRLMEDWVVIQERDRLTAALKRDRMTDENISTLLDQERTATNLSLIRERVSADWEARKSAELLTEEKKALSLAKAALTTRDEILAVVSHDLRNPIGSILSCADMLLEDHADFLDEETIRWIEFIRRNADASLRMISDLLDIERMERGKFTLQLSQVRLIDLIKETISRYNREAFAKTVLLKLKPEADEGFAICDSGRIQQVIGNLIENAIKFSVEGGKIVLNVEENENEVTVSITDTGAGIAEDEIASVFDRYVQVHRLEKRGLGLGLHISKSIVEAHGGKIWVVSKLGEGSTFYFTLLKNGPPPVTSQ